MSAGMSRDEFELLYSLNAGYPLAAPGEIWETLINRGLVTLVYSDGGPNGQHVVTHAGRVALGFSESP